MDVTWLIFYVKVIIFVILIKDLFPFVELIISSLCGFAPIFPDTCYHLTHYWPAAVDIPVASDN
ncbi:hypothetical protein, partial [Escherichia albertii]|uniref:hypothetical protein n=1 Tax=Escherichia albertii TaxID=208962 RepID=UPI0019697A39